MAIQFSSNASEELETIKEIKKTIEEINNIPFNVDISKAFLTMEQVGEMLHCSARSARERLQSEGAPLIMVGKKPLITATALYDHATKYGLGQRGA